ncbi:MAG: bifunctional nuclease family protein [bacterium]
MNEIYTKVSGVGYDPLNKQHIVFLKELDGERIMPIWVGTIECISIARGITQTAHKRPLTHDLIKNILEGMDAKVNKVVINDIKDATYYARIYIQKNNEIIEIDARPSDSLAIAVRCKAPVYISQHVLDNASTFKIKNDDELQHYLQEMKVEDFGKIDL